jgi:branched-chain amino acid transport system ATP-binding protein
VTDSDGPLLRVGSVSRRFGGFLAVDDVSFAVHDGEILGIAGPNGAGKSTLFNLISGLPFGPSSGTVHFSGQRVDRLRPDRISRLGLRRTFQAEQLFSTMTVEENVLVAAAYLRSTRGTAGISTRDATRKALEDTGISQYRAARAADVPLIVKKKLMVASALVGDPQMLMLDEPAGGLDEDDQADLIDLLRRLQADGLTLLIIEHVLSLLKQLAPRMIVMSAGRILAEGSPADVLADSAVIEAYLGQGRES